MDAILFLTANRKWISESVPFGLCTWFRYYYYYHCYHRLLYAMYGCTVQRTTLAPENLYVMFLILLSFNTEHTDRWAVWVCVCVSRGVRGQVASYADTFYLLFSEGLKEIFCLHIILSNILRIFLFPRREMLSYWMGSIHGYSDCSLCRRLAYIYLCLAATIKCLLRVIPTLQLTLVVYVWPLWTDASRSEENKNDDKYENSQDVDGVETMKILCGDGEQKRMRVH